MMYRNLRICSLIFSISIASLFNGCKSENPKPENLIQEDQYIELLVELQLLESYRSVTPQDTLSIDSLKNVIYGRYKVNEQQFVASHRYYQQQIEPQKERIVTAIDRLREHMVQKGLIDSSLLERREAQRPQ